ncbi:MAG: hypothetical protein WBA74_15815 [Cyclobacteriaceae bacterium]
MKSLIVFSPLLGQNKRSKDKNITDLIIGVWILTHTKFTDIMEVKPQVTTTVINGDTLEFYSDSTFRDYMYFPTENKTQLYSGKWRIHENQEKLIMWDIMVMSASSKVVHTDERDYSVEMRSKNKFVIEYPVQLHDEFGSWDLRDSPFYYKRTKQALSIPRKE